MTELSCKSITMRHFSFRGTGSIVILSHINTIALHM